MPLAHALPWGAGVFRTKKSSAFRINKNPSVLEAEGRLLPVTRKLLCSRSRSRRGRCGLRFSLRRSLGFFLALSFALGLLFSRFCRLGFRCLCLYGFGLGGFGSFRRFDLLFGSGGGWCNNLGGRGCACSRRGGLGETGGGKTGGNSQGNDQFGSLHFESPISRLYVWSWALATYSSTMSRLTRRVGQAMSRRR